MAQQTVTAGLRLKRGPPGSIPPAAWVPPRPPTDASELVPESIERSIRHPPIPFSAVDPTCRAAAAVIVRAGPRRVQGAAPVTEAWRPVERVPAEGPEEHIRNALQIVNGLSHMLHEIRERGSYSGASELVLESIAGLEHRLTAALAQLTRENGPV